MTKLVYPFVRACSISGLVAELGAVFKYWTDLGALSGIELGFELRIRTRGELRILFRSWSGIYLSWKLVLELDWETS